MAHKPEMVMGPTVRHPRVEMLLSWYWWPYHAVESIRPGDVTGSEMAKNIALYQLSHIRVAPNSVYRLV